MPSAPTLQANLFDTYMTMLRLVSGFDPTHALVAGAKPEHHGRLMMHDSSTTEVRGWVYVFLFPQAFVVALFDRYSKAACGSTGDRNPDNLTLDTMVPLSVVSVCFCFLFFAFRLCPMSHLMGFGLPFDSFAIVCSMVASNHTSATCNTSWGFGLPYNSLRL